MRGNPASARWRAQCLPDSPSTRLRLPPANAALPSSLPLLQTQTFDPTPAATPPCLLPPAGRFTLDRPLNEAVYGRGVAVEDILAGRLAPPVEFGPFYSLLDNYVRAAMRSPSMARLTLAAGSGRSPRLPSQLGAVSARGLAMQAGGLGSGDTSPPAPGGSPGRSSPPVSAASARTEASSGVDLQAIEEDAAAEASAVRRQTLDFSLA